MLLQLHRQLDSVWNHLGDTGLGTSARVFPDLTEEGRVLSGAQRESGVSITILSPRLLLGTLRDLLPSASPL